MYIVTTVWFDFMEQLDGTNFTPQNNEQYSLYYLTREYIILYNKNVDHEHRTREN